MDTQNPTLGIEQITPQMAETWLANNRDNRKVNDRAVKRYAESMASGRWPLNGDTIVFSKTGRLLQGQHRLSACILAKSSFSSVVVWGVNDDVWPTYDIGRTRRAMDVLVKEQNAAALGRLLTLIWKFENDALGNKSVYPDNTQRVEILRDHPEARESVEFGIKMKSIAIPTLAAFLYWLGRKVNAEKTLNFFDRLKDGANLSADSPVKRYRDYLMQDASTDPQRNEDRAIALGIKAMSAYFSDKQIKSLKYSREKEPFPSLGGS